jgi:hypothetical protein
MPLLTVHLSEYLYFTATSPTTLSILFNLHIKSLLIAFEMLETLDPIILLPLAANHKP